MAKHKFIREGATCWQGGHSTRKGVTRRNRYVTGGNGRKFESDLFSDDWFALGDAANSDGKPYRYRVSRTEADSLTQFCVDTLGDE